MAQRDFSKLVGVLRVARLLLLHVLWVIANLFTDEWLARNKELKAVQARQKFFIFLQHRPSHKVPLMSVAIYLNSYGSPS